MTQVNHEERKTARREARLKESGYGSERVSSDKQVRILSSLHLIDFTLQKAILGEQKLIAMDF